MTDIETQKKILNGKTTNLPLSENSLRLLTRGYLQSDFDGKVIESPDEMLERVARSLAEVELKYGKTTQEVEHIEDKFLSIMTSLEYSPSGRTLSSAGAKTDVIANCIVLHINDSMDSIFNTLKEAVSLQQQGAGLGFPFHLIRPAGEIARRTRGRASGPITFLRTYDYVFDVVKQKSRHGANMAVMSINHPDILEFINCKRKEGDIRTFNISVAVTDEFMRQASQGSKTPWMCEYNGKRMLPRRIEIDKYGVIQDIKEVEITAAEILEEIVDAAWTNGEPGIIFMDEVIRTNPLPGLGKIEACNPCGEQFLHDGDVCNLGSINLSQFVRNDEIDFERLKEVVRVAVRLQDNVIDVLGHSVTKVQDMVAGNRRVGLGVMGFADMLYQLKVPYNSEKGRSIAENITKTITETAHEASRRLAEEKGNFPNYEHSVWAKRGIPMRNSALTTVAPTGKISMFHEVSSGVEPFFSLAYFAKTTVGGTGERFYYVNKYLEKALKERGIYSDELMKKIVDAGGSVQEIEEIPEDLKEVFVTAMDIEATDHVRMLGSFQKNIDNSISKTINFSKDAAPDDIKEVYQLAWELKCKAVSVYRDESRELQILNKMSDEEQPEGSTTRRVKSAETRRIESKDDQVGHMRKRPGRLIGTTHKMETPLGSAFITINTTESGDPVEVFINLGNAGSDTTAFSEGLGRLISGWLRSSQNPREDVLEIIDQLSGIGGSRSLGFGKDKVLSLPDAVAKVLAREFGSQKPESKAKDTPEDNKRNTSVKADICPKCGNSSFIREEGCKKCYSCFHSEC